MNEDLLIEIKNITRSDELSGDDHYIPDENNAHIRTKPFEEGLREIYRESQELKSCDREIIEKFYCHATSYLTRPVLLTRQDLSPYTIFVI